VIFPNKIDKIGIESKKKRSSRDAMFFFSWAAWKPRHMREKWKGKKKIKPTPNRTSSLYMCRLKRKKRLRRIQCHNKTFFSTIVVTHTCRLKATSRWCADACCAYINNLFFMCWKTTSPYDQTTIAKKPSWNDELAPAKMLREFSF